MKIAIIGTGYVGLVTGACFAHMGNQVICVDIDEAKIKELSEGRLPIFEPGLKELINENLRDGRLTFTTDTSEAVAGSEFIFIAVGTPEGEDGSADTQHLLHVAETVGAQLDGYRIIVVKSTVPPGAGEKVRGVIREAVKSRGLEPDFDMVSNPEFLKAGHAVADFLNPDRIVIGADSQKAIERMRRLYLPFCKTDESKILIMDMPSAELTKYAANAMLATRISFMNEMASMCEALGANVDQLRAGIGSDQRIGRRYLFPGVGYGGSCFPKDIRALIASAESLGIDLNLLRAVDQVNQRQRVRFVKKIEAHYGVGQLPGKTFAIWGLSFKPNTDDVRETPAASIIAGLLKAGASVRAYDPVAVESYRRTYAQPIEYSDDMYACLEQAAALVLITDWHHFRRPDLARMKAALLKPIIFDGRNQLEPDHLQGSGFTYISIGRPTREQAP